MNVHQAAHQILSAEGRPLSSKDIAEKALSAGYVTSQSKDPISSIAGTIEKTIRQQKYNDPPLAFVHTVEGRRIALPSMLSLAANGEQDRGCNRSHRMAVKDADWIAACKTMLGFAQQFGQERVLRFLKTCLEQ